MVAHAGTGTAKLTRRLGLSPKMRADAVAGGLALDAEAPIALYVIISPGCTHHAVILGDRARWRDTS